MSHVPDDAPDLAALSPWARELAQTFVSLDSDIALVIDADGLVRNVAQGHAVPLSAAVRDWIGRPWVDTVTADTRGKIERLLAEATSTGLARRREVNHPSSSGDHIPVAYAAVRLGEHGPVLAAGRDLRAIAAIQQRFVDAQREMERGYWSARQAESRYRLLFQVATDAVMIVDAGSLRILEANEAASQMFDLSLDQLAGHDVVAGFEHHSRGAVEELLTTARTGGRAAEIRVRLAGKVGGASVAATPFRGADAMHLLVRVRQAEGPAANPLDLGRSLARLVDGAHEGVVVTDSSGRILAANPAFVELLRAGDEAALKGRQLGERAGLAPTDIESLLTAVRRHGLAQRAGLVLRAPGAPAARVDVSAALLTEGDQECVGLMLKLVGRAADEPEPESAVLTPLAARLGTADLHTLLREANARAQRQLIDAALQRVGGDVAAAATLLGITSRTLKRRRGPGAGDAT